MQPDFHAHQWRKRANIFATRRFRCGNCGLVAEVGAGGVFFLIFSPDNDSYRRIELRPRPGTVAAMQPRRDPRVPLGDEPSCISPWVAERQLEQSKLDLLELLRARARDVALPIAVRRRNAALKSEQARQKKIADAEKWRARNAKAERA